MKISVIIPIYNAEAFLSDTLRDITHQTLEDIEIICVDDGSTDSSKDIVKSFMEQDKRIQLICQSNLYCGVARNNGMAHATGEYLCFWDADDRFKPDALERMYQQASETGADICVCKAENFDSETGLSVPCNSYLNIKVAGDKQPFNKYDIPEYIFNFTTNHVWNKMFSRSFIEKHHLAFGTGDFSEETMFVQPALYYADKICYVNKTLIRYRVFCSSSAVANTSSRKTKYYKDLYNYYYFMKDTGEFDTFKVSILNKCLASCLTDLEANLGFEQYCIVYNDLKTNAFRDLELIDQDESFFRNKTNYHKMQDIMHMEPGDYLLKYVSADKRTLILENQKQKTSNKKKLDKKTKENEALTKKLDEKAKENEALAKKLSNYEKQISNMRNSYYYRIVSKIKHIFHIGKTKEQ